jgi:hypothetical protein
MWKVKRMNTAPIVVPASAFDGGDIAANPARGSGMRAGAGRNFSGRPLHLLRDGNSEFDRDADVTKGT